MIQYLLMLLNITVHVTCVKTHTFINVKYTIKSIKNGGINRRNTYINRILKDSSGNFSLSNRSSTRQSTFLFGVKEPVKGCSREHCKCYINAHNVDYKRNTHLEDSKNDRPTINIITPPPNLTGELHIGNLLNLVCSDVYKNYLILNNNDVNINFSNDHAGQSFQKLFDKTYHLNDNESHLFNDNLLDNIDHSEYDDCCNGKVKCFCKNKMEPSSNFISADKCGSELDKDSGNEVNHKLKLAHSLCKRIKQSHIGDVKALGINWPYGEFSLDSDVEELTKNMFIHFYENHLLSEQNWPSLANYRNNKIEPISSAEVEYRMLPKTIYSLKLHINSGDTNDCCNDFDSVKESEEVPGIHNRDEILIETTIPEFYYATAGIGVSHEDFQKMGAKEVYLPKINKKVPIVPLDTISGDYKSVKDSDSLAGEDGINKEWEDSSGYDGRQFKGVLIIPAHVETDFWIGKKYKLELVNILNINGKLQNVPFRVLGCSLDEAMKDVKGIFEERGKVEVSSPVNIFDNSIRVITLPILHYVLDSQKLSEKALKVFENIKVVPESRRSMIINRLKDIRNWCISRHGWWGIKLPIYYLYNDFNYYKILSTSRGEAEKKAESLTNESIEEVYSKGYRLKRDGRILDTWFTSSLWPILSHRNFVRSTHGQLHKNILFTCYDILETWIVKMLLICSNVNEESLFNEVYLHGMVSDGHGKKMSKSLNNTIVLSQMIRGLTVNLGKFDSDHFDTTGYGRSLNRDPSTSNYKDVDEMEMLIKTNLIRLKLSGMCKCSDFTGNYEDNDRSLYILTKYYQIFKFYKNILTSTHNNNNNEHGNGANIDNHTHDSDKASYMECIIGSKLNEYTHLIGKNMTKFQLSNCILYLEHLIKTFSDYLIPFIRFTVNNRVYELEHFDKYFVHLKSVLYPFTPTFVNSFLLNKFPEHNMAWPTSSSESAATASTPTNTSISLSPSHSETMDSTGYVGDFNGFEAILNGLRRAIIANNTDLRVDLPNKLYSDFTTSFINYLIELTFNKTPNINYVQR